MRVDHVDLDHIIKVFEAVDGLQFMQRHDWARHRQCQPDHAREIYVFREAAGAMIPEINFERASAGEKPV